MTNIQALVYILIGIFAVLTGMYITARLRARVVKYPKMQDTTELQIEDTEGAKPEPDQKTVPKLHRESHLYQRPK